MKTYLIALAASAAFVTAAMAGEVPNTDPNMQPAPAAIPAPATPAATTESTSLPEPAAPTASVPDDKAKMDAKDVQVPAPATTASMPSKTDEKAALTEKAPPPKRTNERHVKYHNGEGSTWKTGRNAYGFEGSFGGCQFRGHAGPDGYHIDKAC